MCWSIIKNHHPFQHNFEGFKLHKTPTKEGERSRFLVGVSNLKVKWKLCVSLQEPI